MELEDIKNNLGEQLAKTNDVDKITKYLNALNVIKSIEKTDADKRKSELDIENVSYQKRSELKKFAVSVIAPFLTSLALIATVFVQILQTHSNYALQMQDKEDEQWKTFLDRITSPTVRTDPSIPIFLKTFYQSATYKDKACELTTTTYFPSINNSEDFNNLYPDYIKTIDAHNYGNLVQLTLKLYDHYKSLQEKLPEDKSDLSGCNKGDTAMSRYYTKLIKEDNDDLNTIFYELSTVCSGLKEMVSRLNASAAEVKLNQAYFLSANLDNISLKGADITDAAFEQVSLKNADLSGIENFDHSDWDDTRWWQAKYISMDLLKYLITNYPYEPQSPPSADDKTKYDQWVKKYQAWMKTQGQSQSNGIST